MKGRALAIGAGVAIVVGLLGPAKADEGWDDIFFTHVVGDVTDAWVTPDGTRAVFRADLWVDNLFELFSVPTDGSENPIRVSQPLHRYADVENDVLISPDGLYVAYIADGEELGVRDLYCVPVDGSAAPAHVSSLAVLDFITEFTFTPDSAQIVYEGRTPDLRDEIWYGPLDGSSASLVSGTLRPLGIWTVTQDSLRILFKAVQAPATIGEIFTTLLDGSVPIAKINGSVVVNGSVWEWAVTPDGTRVVYRAEQEANNQYALYTRPIDGSGTDVRISGALAVNVEVEDNWVILPNADVVFLSDHNVLNSNEVYKVPADGSSAPVKLTGNDFVPDETCEDFLVSSAGYVVYRADQDTNNVIELYSVPLDGSQTSVKLSGSMVSGGDAQFRYKLSADGLHVAYRADQDVNNQFELYGAPVDGSSAAVKLNPTLAPNRDVPILFYSEPGGSRVVFNAGTTTTDDQPTLWARPFDGSSAAVGLNDIGGASFAGFGTVGRVLYKGILDPDDTDFIVELFEAPLDDSEAPAVLHAQPVLGALDGEILSYRLSGDGSSVAYVAREKEGHALYFAPISAPECSVRLASSSGAPLLLQQDFLLSDDGLNIAFVWTTVSVHHELYTVPTDGSAQPVKISGILTGGGDVANERSFTPDGTRVVYRADAFEDNRYELFSAPTAGGQVPTQLSATLVAGGDVIDFKISPDSAFVVYLADQDTDTQTELYSVPVDGSSAPVKLNGTLLLSTRVLDDFSIHPDSSRVFYRSDEDVLTEYDLFTVPIDGSSAATQLNTPLPNDGEVLEYQIDASGSVVVYRATQDVDYAAELYTVPSDGSAAPIKLNISPVNQGNVGDFFLSADGTRVVFGGNLIDTDTSDVWSAPADGSSAAIRVHEVLPSGVRAGPVGLTPNGASVIYLRSTAVHGVHDLYTAPTDASSSPILVHSPYGAPSNVPEMYVAPDSSHFFYRANYDENTKYEVFSVPADGSSPSIKLSGVLVENGTVKVLSLGITPDSTSVLFLSDKYADRVQELFIAPLDGVVQRASGTPSIEPKRLHPPLFVPKDLTIETRDTSGTGQKSIRGSATGQAGL